ncbi:response regulator transcription factor [Paenibacillus agaridevorans]|uniref:response regulator transcription factor n=1 Tax=Paenibacillus agaridevorans TaxID=171404 RepID=UPI001BE41618|nr:response regulator transcription factor [Paenibacillus agaridevorans]
MSYHLLLFEEDPTLANILCYQLNKSGHRVQLSSAKETLVQFVADYSFDMVILDVDQHGISNSNSLFQLVTSKFDVPFIILTAIEEDADIAFGFMQGAEDVIRKPFGYGELISRIHAVMRRMHENSLLPFFVGDFECAFQFGFFKLYPQRLELHFYDQVIKLKPSEYKLIYHFMSFPNQVISKQNLSEVLHGEMKENSSLVQAIAAVRKKLLLVSTHIRIETVRSDGYRLVMD